MMSMLIFGFVGGLVAAGFAWPYGWFAAFGAYAFGGALCAMVPALIEWRQEVLRGRAESDETMRNQAATSRLARGCVEGSGRPQ